MFGSILKLRGSALIRGWANHREGNNTIHNKISRKPQKWSLFHIFLSVLAGYGDRDVSENNIIQIEQMCGENMNGITFAFFPSNR